MYYETQAITIELKHCRACGVQLFAAHNFCRRCGLRQSPAEPVTQRYTRDFLTTTLPLSTALAPRIKSRAAKRAVTAAITVPLWLMIVLRSPFDALEASRRVTQQL